MLVTGPKNPPERRHQPVRLTNANHYNASGVAQWSEFRVNTTTTDNQRYSTVAMDADGDFVVTWTSYLQDGDGEGIYAQRYNASGVAQGSEFRVNTYTTHSQLFSTVAMDADGDFVVTWTSWIQDGSEGVYAQRYDASGVAQGGEFRVNTTTTDHQRYSTVAMDADGDFVVTWSSNGQDGSLYGVYGKRYNASGVAQSSEFRVNTYTTGHQRYSSVAMDADGDFVVTWSSLDQDGHGEGVYAQRFAATSVVILSWSSAATHGSGVGEVGLTVPDDGLFVESRSAGVRKVLVRFDRPVDPATFTPAAVLVAGNSHAGGLNLSGITISTSLLDNNTLGVISFSAALPNYAKYLVRLSGVAGPGGVALSGDADRVFTALIGDVSGDGRVNATDLSRVRGASTGLVNPTITAQIRADVSVDGRVNATDLSRVQARNGNDARGIVAPTGGSSVQSSPQSASGPLLISSDEDEDESEEKWNADLLQ